MAELNSNNDVIIINMFGGFSIKAKDKILTDDTGRSKQIWNLLQYIILNRYSDVSQEKLIDVCWNDESSDNPVNALKNLVYRIRITLDSFFCDKNCNPIIFKRNTYCWNNELPCLIDVEEFEKAWKKTKQKNIADEEKISLYKKAIDLYKGELLPKSSQEDWVVFNSAHYSRIFIECIHGLSNLLLLQKKYDDIITICEKAISFNIFDESLHDLIINTYIKIGDSQKAINHYNYVSNLFYEKLGVKLSEDLHNVRRNLMISRKEVETDFMHIKNDLSECKNIEGAYYCDYEIFKNLYRIEVRLSERMEQSVLIILLTLDFNIKKVDKPNIISNTMDLLKSIIMKYLRKNDVVAKFSESQYILMLPSLTCENEQLVLNRIMKEFNKENKNTNIFLNTKSGSDSQINKV